MNIFEINGSFMYEYSVSAQGFEKKCKKAKKKYLKK